MAAGLLDQGYLTPLSLMKVCDLDASSIETLEKYNPDQPRVPAGNSDGGQWTSDGSGAGQFSVPRLDARPKSKSPPSNQIAIVMPDGCDEQWAWAIERCTALLAMDDPPRSLTGGHTTTIGCARGYVSARCGGNPT